MLRTGGTCATPIPASRTKATRALMWSSPPAAHGDHARATPQLADGWSIETPADDERRSKRPSPFVVRRGGCIRVTEGPARSNVVANPPLQLFQLGEPAFSLARPD